MRDRRFICWLTQDGVDRVKQDRDRIMQSVKGMREGDPIEVAGRELTRHLLMKRVLYLNQLLHYNGNPATNQGRFTLGGVQK